MRYEQGVADLRRGQKFETRRQLSHMVGGTPFRGISYRTGAAHVAVVSGSPSPNRFNYRDRWLDKEKQEFQYYGQWYGCQDMTMTGGNAAIEDRSPHLYLFIHDGDGYVFEGRFRYVSRRTELTVHPDCANQQFKAIVFRLARI